MTVWCSTVSRILGKFTRCHEGYALIFPVEIDKPIHKRAMDSERSTTRVKRYLERSVTETFARVFFSNGPRGGI